MDGDVTVLVVGDERAAAALAAAADTSVGDGSDEPTPVEEPAPVDEPTGGLSEPAGGDTASADAETPGLAPATGSVVTHAPTTGVTEALDGQDAVVVADTSLSDRAVSALDTASAPVVAYAAEQPTAAWIDGFVRRTAGEPDGRRLCAEIGRALSGETRLQLRMRRRQLARLHDGAAYLASARSESELYDRTVSVAADVVTFDRACLLVDRGDRFVIVAGTAGVRSDPADWQAVFARETLDRGTPRIVDDADAELAGDDRENRANADEPVVAPADDGGETAEDGDRSVADETRPPDEETATGRPGAVLSVPVGEDAVLQTAADEQNAFDATDLELAQLLATHARETRERLRAEADAQNRRERIATLHEAATDLIDADTETAVFDRTVEIATEVLELDHCVLAEATARGFYARAAKTDLVTPGERLADRSEGLLGLTHRRGKSVLEDDLQNNSVAEPADAAFAAALSVPFPGVGVLQAVSQEANTYDETDLELTELLVSYASTTVERIRSETALRKSRQTVERLYEAATEVAAAETEAAVAQRAVAAAEDVLELDRCALSVIDENGEQLVPVGASEGARPKPMSVDDGLAGRTYRTGETVVVDDLHANSDAEPTKDDYRSAISVPIGDIGVFQAVATETAAFDKTDADRLELLMAHVGVALGRVEAEAGLRAERDRFSALFENIPDAVVSFEMIDGAPIVQEVNAAFEETFGYERSTVIDADLDEFIAPEDVQLETPADELNQRLRDGENIRVEVQRVTKQGTRDFLMYVVPLELGAENVGGFAIYSDITDRKERERELRRQNERLDEFASVVSHDLRNPISIADGYLDMARETGDASHFTKVQDAIDRMEALVEDLLELAREGEVVGDAEPVAVTDIADAAWRHVDTADATLELEGAVTVEADGDRLTQLFENLFRNAVEHAGSDATVRVVPTDEGFAVGDDGPGIPPEDRDEVFAPGTSTTDDGTGFGLPIVRRIAEAHGWTVHIEESADGGARFVFTVNP